MDEDVALAMAWKSAVERDIHKMHAYVRFREAKGLQPPAFIAWFEPSHHIVEEAAQFFVRRFANVRWTILTPEISAVWDTTELRFGPGAQRADAPGDDATVDLWRSYYMSIFNPARLKVRAMQGHMPKKYWRNLPESVVIPGLIRSAEKRTHAMLDAAATTPAKHHRGTVGLASRGHWRPQLTEPPGEIPSLPQLAAQAGRCRRCDLWRNATQTVFGEGPADARVVLVGEQPGDREDIVGSPFVGPAGQLLERALGEAGIDRRVLYVTNAVKHFKFEPRGKRRLHKTPSQQQAAACRSWLERELSTIRPRLVVALGATAARSLAGREMLVGRNRGRVIAGVLAGDAELLITVHPSFLLRLPPGEREPAYREFVADLELMAAALQPSE
jgi:DNA polymerase